MKRLIICFLLVIPAFAFAQDASPKINFTQLLVGLDGKSIPYSDKDSTPVTLGRMVKLALIIPQQGDDPDQKFYMADLAHHLYECKSCSLSHADGDLIIKRVKAQFTPEVVWAMLPLLDSTIKQK